MNILILGGTLFLGRALVTTLVEAGHTVTIFHRGKTPLNDKQSTVTEVLGDRKESFAELDGMYFDATIDTCGYYPADVQKSCKELNTLSDRYIFISSLSVYANTDADIITEEYPCATLDNPYDTALDGVTYGALKYHCEQEVLHEFGNRATIIRPGLIVGPHDPTDRFTYWIDRGKRGGSIIAPAPVERHIQFIDVNDLAQFICLTIENETTGIYNTTSPSDQFRFCDVINESALASHANYTIVEIAEQFLLENEVQPWMGLPLWIPQRDELRGFYKIDVTKAMNKGLAIRSLSETVRDTLEWWNAERNDTELKAGISVNKEQELFELWKQQLS